MLVQRQKPKTYCITVRSWIFEWKSDITVIVNLSLCFLWSKISNMHMAKCVTSQSSFKAFSYFSFWCCCHFLILESDVSILMNKLFWFSVWIIDTLLKMMYPSFVWFFAIIYSLLGPTFGNRHVLYSPQQDYHRSLNSMFIAN